MLICVGTVGNAAPILIFRWERRSHTYSYFSVGTQFLQRSVTISIRPIYSWLNRQSCHWWMCSYICEPCCVSSWARSLRQIVTVIAPPFSLPLHLPPSVSPPHSPSLSGVPPLPSNTASGSGGALGAPTGPGRVRPPNAFWGILV